MQDIDELRKEHPTWVPSNILQVAECPDDEDGFRIEALLETPCIKCNKEMGTHTFGFGRMNCPP